MKKVLVLAPHTDDGELGCGGTVARLLEEGCEVSGGRAENGVSLRHGELRNTGGTAYPFRFSGSSFSRRFF